MKDNKRRILGMLLALLMVLGVAAMPSAPAQGAAPTGGDIQAVPLPDTVEALSGAVGSYGQVSHKVDASSNLFVAYGNLNPANSNQTWGELHEYNPQGALLDTWIINPAPEFKLDSLDATFSCPDIKIALTTHSYVGTRRREVEESTIPGVFNCGSGGQAGQLAKEGGPNAYQPSGTGGGGGGGLTDADLAAIQGIVHTEVQAAMHTEIDNLLPKMGIALANAKVLTLDNIYRSDGLYARIAETSFQSNINALTVYGAAKQPTSTPTPRP